MTIENEKGRDMPKGRNSTKDNLLKAKMNS